MIWLYDWVKWAYLAGILDMPEYALITWGVLRSFSLRRSTMMRRVAGRYQSASDAIYRNVGVLREQEFWARFHLELAAIQDEQRAERRGEHEVSSRHYPAAPTR